MRVRIPLVLGMAAAVVACSSYSPPEEYTRRNDPYAELSDSQVFIEKGIRYMDSGLYDVALKDLEKAVELDDENSEAYNALGVLYQRIENVPKADASFRKALALKPDNYAARNNYGRFLCSEGKYAEAATQFQTVIGTKLYNQPWIALTNFGLCAQSAGKKGEAELYLRQALEAEPNFPPALLGMAKLMRETGQNLSARAFLQRYFGAAAPTAESLALGIEIETALRNPQAAEEYARTLQRQFPNSREASQARHRSFQ